MRPSAFTLSMAILRAQKAPVRPMPALQTPSEKFKHNNMLVCFLFGGMYIGTGPQSLTYVFLLYRDSGGPHISCNEKGPSKFVLPHTLDYGMPLNKESLVHRFYCVSECI